MPFLTRRIKSFLLRRTEDHVAKELLAWTEMVIEEDLRAMLAPLRA